MGVDAGESPGAETRAPSSGTDEVIEGRDVGTAEFGFPLSPEERADLDDRARFAGAVGASVIPFLEGQPGYGGSYIDQLNRGGLVVLLTDDADAASIKAGVVDRLSPADADRVVFREAIWTEKELQDLALDLGSLWPEIAPGLAPPFGAIVRVDENRILVEVDPEVVDEANQALKAATEILGGIPVVAIPGEQAEPAG